jgi:peroxidase
MIKIAFGLLVIVALAECGKCPHSIKKRQIGPGGGGGGPMGGGRGPTGGGAGPNNGGPGGPINGGPGGDNTNNQPPPDQLRPPPDNGQGNKGDRRPRPTNEPLSLPITNPQNCDPNSKYYTFDGNCNNLRTPNLGVAGTSFKRYLKAEYTDGVSSPRTKSVTGGDLPNPRIISRALMNDNSEFETNYSDLLVYFGQFLGHDITEIQDAMVDGDFVECPCGSTNANCLSYAVPLADNKLTQSCLEFTRSGASASTFTGGESFEQINHLTSFIDGTQVYGSSKELSDDLRTFSNGQMKTSNGADKNSYLPLSPDDFSCSVKGDLQCFVAGEARPSENLALTGVQTIFLREHNRIAKSLTAINRQWSDEVVYQEARRINIAVMQQIIYSEFLPLLIGSQYNLKPLVSGYYNGYDQNVNPACSNEFAVAAFRFGHSLIRNSLDRYNYAYSSVNSVVNLSEIIFDSTEAYSTSLGLGGIESIFMGLLSQPTSKFDSNIVDHLQNHLFEFNDGGSVIALDLPATNINRGRDHAIPAYYKYRQMCGNTVNNWNDLTNVMSTANILKLASMYQSVKDIDLFVGGLNETPQQDALVGPTFACIIQKQFEDLKKGDRLYFENGQSSATRFSSAQLQEIRKVKFSSLICDNFAVSTVQPNAFKMALGSLGNARTSCNNIASMDLSKWRQ